MNLEFSLLLLSDFPTFAGNLYNIMNKFVFYLPVKPFIGQWLTNHYGSPVVFPARSVENACIRRFVGLNPKGHIPKKPMEEHVVVVIPDNKHKKPLCWNYMSKSACNALLELIEDNFMMQMWIDLNEMTRCGCTILNSVRAWCENNGISTDYDYTIKMRYQRMRKTYMGKGVVLMRTSRASSRE